MEGAPPTAATASAHTRAEADRLVLHLVTTHAESLLRVARRYSYCADDAQDAYQRALEILLRHAHRLDRDRAAGWIHTVVKHEALEVRRQRGRLVGMEEVDLDRLEERTAESPEERVIGIERVARTAEALGRVKPDEARALWLKASGESYASIGAKLSWSYTKVNRCLAEGRKSFLEHFEGIEAGESCERWLPVLTAIVDGEADADAVLEARSHLRHCTPCRATLRHLRMADRSLAVLLPLGGGVPAAAGLDLDVDWPDGPDGLFGRLADALSSFFHERAAAATVRLQSTIDLAANHKVAAVAASAAAMAGGGVAVEQAHPELGHARPAIQARTTPPSRTAPLRPSAAVVRHVTSGTAAPPAAASRPRDPKPEPASARSRTTSTPAAAPATEPLVDPVESTAPSTPARTATAAPARSSTPNGPDPNAEFGLRDPLTHEGDPMQHLRRSIFASLFLVVAFLLTTTSAHAAAGTYTYIACANPDTGTGVMSADGALPPGFTGFYSHTVGPAASETRCGPGSDHHLAWHRRHGEHPLHVQTLRAMASAASRSRARLARACSGVLVYRNGRAPDSADHMTFSVHSGPGEDHYYPPAAGALRLEPQLPFTRRLRGSVVVAESGGAREPVRRVDSAFSLGLRHPGHRMDVPGWRPVSSVSSARSSRWPTTRTRRCPGSRRARSSGSGVVRGTGDVTVNATDSGSGVYRVKLVVDDVVRLTRVVDANGGRCADVNPANDDEYEFADPAPCKTSAGGTYRFDTAGLPEGDHTLQVLLEDAAGNSATLANRSVTVDNVPDPQTGGNGGNGGAGGSWHQRRERRPGRPRRRRRRRRHGRQRRVRRPFPSTAAQPTAPAPRTRRRSPPAGRPRGGRSSARASACATRCVAGSPTSTARASAARAWSSRRRSSPAGPVRRAPGRRARARTGRTR